MEPHFITTIFTYTFGTKLRCFVWRSCFALSVRTLEKIANTGYPAEVDCSCSAVAEYLPQLFLSYKEEQSVFWNKVI